MTVILQKKQELSTSVIERIRVYAIQYGLKEYSWSAWMPEMTNTDTLVRLETKDGQTGIGAVSSCSERDIDLSIAYNMKPLLRGLLGKDGLQVEENWQWMAQRRPYVHNSAIAALDIAMWDLLAKQNDLPLSSLLGGKLDVLQAYASIPVLENPTANVEFIHQLAQAGFAAFKFHNACVPDPDIKLIKTIAREFQEQQFGFMFDAECGYDLPGALQVAEYMQGTGFIWLEAPFPDRHYSDYRALCQSTKLQILPAGLSVVEPEELAVMLPTGCWSTARVDLAMSGGITPILKITNITTALGLGLELVAWSSPISTAATLQVSLGTGCGEYFEIAVPQQDFLIPSSQPLQVNPSGKVSGSSKTGLGVDLDWQELEQTEPPLFDIW